MQQPAGEPVAIVQSRDKGDTVLALLIAAMIIVLLFMMFILVAFGCLGGALIWVLMNN